MVRPVALLILDGVGCREDSRHNALAAAHTPTLDTLAATVPHTQLQASAQAVGLPAGQQGNSEVGHMTIGAGRAVMQEIARIDAAIANGSFAANAAFGKAFAAAGQQRTLHIVGLLSAGGVHSHEAHLLALHDAAVAAGVRRICFHVFLDGRDTLPRAAEASLVRLQQHMATAGIGKIATICGRYYAMDRDNRWARTERAYRLLVDGVADHQAPDALAALRAAYDRGEDDEFVLPTQLLSPTATSSAAGTISDGDAVVLMNFRADRIRQLTRALVDEPFTAFARPHKRDCLVVTLTEYAAGLPVEVAFSPQRLPNVLGEVLSAHGLRQFRIAETEKYAHVTFFFNGGREVPFAGEDRVLIPSPAVATYDQQPQMAAAAVTDRLCTAITDGGYDFLLCNYANPDMVGHTGNFAAAVTAVETVDSCLARVLATLRTVGGAALVTADHGNVELLYDDTAGQPHTSHTTNPVPLYCVGADGVSALRDGGTLADIAPTVLDLLALAKPAVMTGQSCCQR